jgi:hypothetical protein
VANQVFANMMEVSCKAAKGKSICCFPDVCFTPPPPPGVPVPYPNTGVAKDCTNGSRTVKISKREVMLKNKSYFKKSTGDEAGRAPKKGVVTSKITGKVYFNAWSMDVRIEGENAVRNLDMTTHNHGSQPGNTAPWPYVDEAATPGAQNKCKKDMKREKKSCKDAGDPCEGELASKPPSGSGWTRAKVEPFVKPKAEAAAKSKCLNARRCRLSPHSGSGKSVCCPGQTEHHLVEASSFGKGRGSGGSRVATFSNSPQEYSEFLAPCVCVEGTSHSMGGTHEAMHRHQKTAADAVPISAAGLPTADGGNTGPARVTNYRAVRDSGIEAFQRVFRKSGCSKACLKAQLDAYHKRCGITGDTKCIAINAGPGKANALKADAETARLFQLPVR